MSKQNCIVVVIFIATRYYTWYNCASYKMNSMGGVTYPF